MSPLKILAKKKSYIADNYNSGQGKTGSRELMDTVVKSHLLWGQMGKSSNPLTE